MKNQYLTNRVREDLALKVVASTTHSVLLGLKSKLPSVSLNIALIKDKGMWLPPSWAD